MVIRTMDDLFFHGLQDVYYAENQIAKTLPEMMEKSSDPMLREGFKLHLEETQEQIKRLDQVFQALGQAPKGVTCQAVLGLIEEGQEVVVSARLMTRISGTQPSSHPLRPSNITRSTATARSSPGRSSLAIEKRSMRSSSATWKSLTSSS